MKYLRLFALLWLLLFFVTGCATIPSEAPTLSQELAKRISAIEAANINLLHKFFGQKRKDLDRFINEEWIPVFADEVFSIPKIQRTWEKIVSDNNKHDRLMFLIKLGPRLQNKINQKRLELVKPLDDLERDIERKLRAEYDQARSINNTITSLLLSASKVTENRDRYLDLIGVTDEKLSKTIDKIDTTVEDLLGKTKDLPEKIEKGKQFIERLKKIRLSL